MWICSRGLESDVLKCIEVGGAVVKAKLNDGLRAAMFEGHEPLAMKLIDMGANLYASDPNACSNLLVMAAVKHLYPNCWIGAQT